MLYLIAFAGAAVIAVLLWRAMNTERAPERAGVPRPQQRASGDPARPRVSGPDDDPEFLRRLDEGMRKEDPPPGP